MPTTEARQVLDLFEEMWRDPYSAIAERGRTKRERPIGYFCSYVPEEILHAGGLTPVRIVGAERQVMLADAHLQSYCCSIARTSLELALGGELDFLDGTVFVQTCDTMQRLSDIWRLNTSFGFHGDVVLPTRMGDPLGVRYLTAELGAFRDRVSEFVGRRIEDAQLHESIRVYNRNRDLCERLYELLARGHPWLTGKVVLGCVMAGMWMRKEEHNLLVEKVLEWAEDAAPVGGESGSVDGPIRLLVSGSLCTGSDLIETIEGLGAVVADDDLCCGHRYVEGRTEETGDPLEAMAQRLSDRVICPAKHSSGWDRPSYLLRKAKGAGVVGVVFFLQHFCEPHAFDYPFVRDALEAEGLKTLLIEADLDSASSGQMRTRVEAFLEVLGGI